MRQCCRPAASAASVATVYDIEEAATLPALPRPTGSSANRNKRLFAILGPFHRRVLAEFFQWLMDRPLGGLLAFIAAAILALTLAFWPFYVLLAGSFAPTNSDGVTVGTVETATAAADAFVVSFGALFSQTTHWTANNASSVFLVTLQAGIGKLTLSGLTALLVMKVSRVPNHVIVSDALLVHVYDDEWHISLRLGTLYYQVYAQPRYCFLYLFCGSCCCLHDLLTDSILLSFLFLSPLPPTTPPHRLHALTHTH
jgi:hypothetical protein